MNIFLILSFLFFIGSVFGWVLEVFYRRFFSSLNPERKWINPGFLVGPYVPLYGFGLCILYALAGCERDLTIADPVLEKLVLFALMALCVTALEFATGMLCLRVMKVRLWDYSGNWGNLCGVICPKFSLYWAVLSAVYYFFIHPHILSALEWLSGNLAFSFVVGFFFGVFAIDLAYSSNILVRIRAFARDNDLVVRLEELRAHIREGNEKRLEKALFFLSMHSSLPLSEQLSAYADRLRAEAAHLRENANKLRRSVEDKLPRR
ncbi:MAG: putative ABC transporter permease [Oscillospiraceae bacterium]|nr:putative ABC transporter permease [Oscillospiraceae bacterium]